MALELIQRDAIREAHPLRVQEHLAEVILLHDDELARALVERRLGPLLELPVAERERLFETLRAWLDHQRHPPGVAAELHVHPQTVRYRVAKLRELLGDALETADGRLELQMALRARAALAA
jgi:DNA-binding PucR family transcriptional regulator